MPHSSACRCWRPRSSYSCSPRPRPPSPASRSTSACSRRSGQPGQPEPVAIGPDGRVYVGTNQLGHGDTDAPSKIFAFSPAGELVREYVLEGQPLDENHGIQGLVFDRDGLLYALDRSANPRVVVLDPATGKQRVYATLPRRPAVLRPAATAIARDTARRPARAPTTRSSRPTATSTSPTSTRR